MSPFIHSTNLSLRNENPVFSNSFPTSTLNEKNRPMHVNTSENCLSPNSRVNVGTPSHSRSKTLQRLPPVDKETCYYTIMNARKHKPNLPLNQRSYPSEKTGSRIFIPIEIHNRSKAESFPSINAHPNNSPSIFKDVYSTRESCLPNLTLAVSKNQDHTSNISNYSPQHLNELYNFNLPFIKDLDLLKPSLSFDDEIPVKHLSHYEFLNKKSQRLPQLFTATTITSNIPVTKNNNSSFRRLIPSIRSFRRKLLPTQSFDISRSRQYSEDCLKSLKLQKSFCDLSTDKYRDYDTINTDSRLKTSHSADTCLHSYSNYNEFLCREDKISKNSYNNLDNSNCCRTYPINHKSREHNLHEKNSSTIRDFTSGKPQYLSSPNSSDHYCNNQQVFMPIMRSESTPCICSPSLRIGIKRRANEIERPTANFAKMWVSQFDPNDSTSDVSPLHDRKRFSSRSPESIPDEWGSESYLEIQDIVHNAKSFELKNFCNEKLDLQSIEEN